MGEIVPMPAGRNRPRQDQRAYFHVTVLYDRDISFMCIACEQNVSWDEEKKLYVCGECDNQLSEAEARLLCVDARRKLKAFVKSEDKRAGRRGIVWWFRSLMMDS